MSQTGKSTVKPKTVAKKSTLKPKPTDVIKSAVKMIGAEVSQAGVEAFAAHSNKLSAKPTPAAKSSANDKKFWKEGLRFECQGSGKCCTSHGEFGFVFLTPADRQRFAEYLKITPREFTKKYCDRTNGVWHLKEDGKNPDCMFLKDKRCSVYHARPSQCRTWPFWNEVMNAKAWAKDVAAFCPGVGKGKLWTESEIDTVLAAETASERQLGK